MHHLEIAVLDHVEHQGDRCACVVSFECQPLDCSVSLGQLEPMLTLFTGEVVACLHRLVVAVGHVISHQLPFQL